MNQDGIYVGGSNGKDYMKTEGTNSTEIQREYSPTDPKDG